MGLPAKADLEFLARAEIAQKFKHRAALLSRQPLDMGRELAIDVKRFAFCHGVFANDGMRRFWVDLAGLGDTHQLIIAPVSVIA